MKKTQPEKLSWFILPSVQVSKYLVPLSQESAT